MRRQVEKNMNKVLNTNKILSSNPLTSIIRESAEKTEIKELRTSKNFLNSQFVSNIKKV